MNKTDAETLARCIRTVRLIVSERGETATTSEKDILDTASALAEAISAKADSVVQK